MHTLDRAPPVSGNTNNGFGSVVSRMGRPLCPPHLVELTSRCGLKRPAPCSEFDIFPGRTDIGRETESAPVVEEKRSESSLADASRFFQNCMKYRLQVAMRRADDAQDFSSCSLLLQRFPQFMPQYVEATRARSGQTIST